MTTDKNYLSDNPCRKPEHQPTYRYRSTDLCVECSRENNKKQTPEQRAGYRAAAKRRHVEMKQKRDVRTAALQTARQWHVDQARVISKSGREDMQASWMSAQHQDQIDLLNAAILEEQQ